MTRRRIIALVLTLATIIGITAMVSISSAGATSNPAIFLAPHQDDEILSMGADLRTHVNAGRNVQVYVMTDGSSSGACGALTLTRVECTAARDAETVTGLGWLGVPATHIHFAADPATGKRVQDGSMSVAAATRIINGIAADYPDTDPSWKSMRWDDDNGDHAAIGAALRADCSSVGGDCRYYLKQEANGAWPRPAGVVIASLPCLTATADLRAVRVANHVYGLVSVMSVPAQFANQYAHPCSEVTK